MIKLHWFGLLIDLFRDLCAPRIIPQIIREIDNSSTDLESIKFQSRRSHAIHKFREHYRILAHMSWWAFPHAIMITLVSKFHKKHVRPYRSENQTFRVSPSRTESVGVVWIWKVLRWRIFPLASISSLRPHHDHQSPEGWLPPPRYQAFIRPPPV